MWTLCAVNSQSRVSQLVLVATKTDFGSKNDSFLPIFATFYFSTPRWSEARISRIVRASLSTSTPKHTPPQCLCFLQEVGWKIWKILLSILIRKQYEGLILINNELWGQSKLTWYQVCRAIEPILLIWGSSLLWCLSCNKTNELPYDRFTIIRWLSPHRPPKSERILGKYLNGNNAF